MRAHDQVGGHQAAMKSSVGLAVWTIGWTTTLALARFGPTHLWDAQPSASWVAVALNLAVGIGWILAHARYLRGIDELQRKIMQDALAVTFGVGWVGGFAYVVADAADLIAGDPNLGIFPTVLGIVYVVAVFVGHLRFR